MHIIHICVAVINMSWNFLSPEFEQELPWWMMEFLVLEFHYHTERRRWKPHIYNAFIALHCSIVEHTPIRSVVRVIYFLLIRKWMGVTCLRFVGCWCDSFVIIVIICRYLIYNSTNLHVDKPAHKFTHSHSMSEKYRFTLRHFRGFAESVSE